MFVRFVAPAKRIFVEQNRLAFYYRPGEQLDLPDDWALEHIGREEAVAIPPPGTNDVPDAVLPPSLGDDILTVACVLKSGGVYDEHDYVGPLARAVARNLTVPHRFVCLTDAELAIDGVEVEPLRHGWRGFWSKIELYRPGLFTGPVMALDLDMVVCGNLDDLARATAPLLCTWDMMHSWINSSLTRWSVDLSCVYDAMVADPSGMMRAYESGAKWGDQGLLQDTLVAQRIPWRWFQSEFPGQVWWHPNAYRSAAAPTGVRVANWCGHPKMHQITDSDWLRAHWV